MSYQRILSLFSILFLWGCPGSEHKLRKRVRDVPEFFTYKHIDVAPSEIQQSSTAIVQIIVGNTNGTGFFVSGDGLLMTNNHVLGSRNCSVHGCFVSLVFDFQRGKKQAKDTYVARPVFSDLGLDVSLFQIAKDKSGSSFYPSHYLSFSSQSSSSLMGQKLFFVGHPTGTLKKWVATEVFDTAGTQFSTDNLSLGGSSGSPYLNSEGKVVGILHSGPVDGGRLLTRHGYKSYSDGTNSQAILEALETSETRFSLHSVKRDLLAFKDHTQSEPLDKDNVEVIHNIFLSSRDEEHSKFDSNEEALLEFVEKQCDEMIAKKVTRDNVADTWFYCVTAPIKRFKTLDQYQKNRWEEKGRKYADILYKSDRIRDAFHVFLIYDEFITSDKEQRKQNILQYLEKYPSKLDFGLIAILTRFGVSYFNEIDLKYYVERYAEQTHYEKYYPDIIDAMGFLNQMDLVDFDVIRRVVASALADGNISLEDYLRVEKYAYYVFPERLGN